MADTGMRREAASRPARKRLDPHERAREITQGAISYFSEVGFGGSMRDLAKRLGISHALLFRYFPTKEALVDRVYDEVFLSRWDDTWDALLEDRSASFRDRLIRFYTAYLAVIDRPEWVRIFVYGGLSGVNINQRYLKLIRRKVIAPVAAELIALAGVRGKAKSGLEDAAHELSWGLHGEVFYFAIRHRIYGAAVPRDVDDFVEMTVTKFLDGAPAALQLSQRRT